MDSTFIRRYVNLIYRWRWSIVIATVIFVGFLSSGARFLSFTNDYRIFFSDANPNLQALQRLHNTYTKDDTVLFVITVKNGSVFTKRTLERLAWLTEEAWSIPYIQRVDSLINYQHSYSVDDELIVQDLIGDVGILDDEAIQRIKGIVMSEPLLLNRLISKDNRVTGIHATIQLPGIDEVSEVPEVANYARKLAKNLMQIDSNLEVRLTGGIMISNAFPEASQHDMETLIPIMFLIILFMLALLLRSVTATFWVLLVVAFSISSTMGLAGWLGFGLSPPSAITPNVILTIAVADGVHVLVSYLHTMRGGWVSTQGWKEQRFLATAETLEINFRPVFITSLTTALGFLSLNFSDSPPFHDLGNIVAMGVMIAFALSIVFLPAMMMIMPIHIRPYKMEGARAIEKVSHFVIKHRKSLLIVLTLFVAVMFSFLRNIELNDDSIKYFNVENPFRADTEYATDHLTGMYVMEYSIRAEDPGGINDPLYLQVLDKFAKWYRLQPETLHVYSITDVLKKLNKNMHSDDPSWYQLPDSNELAAQYLLLYEMSLPEGLDLNDRINVDKSASRLTVAIRSLSSNEMLELEHRAESWLKKNAPIYMQAKATGPNLMFAHIGRTNIKGMLLGTAIAFVLIAFVLIFALKSLSIGVLSLLPNVIPAGMAFGLWGIVNGQINLGVSIVASLTLGIVVDDTVHFLSKYLHAKNVGKLGSVAAVNYAFIKVGTALWVTSAVLIAGFLVLTFSDFELNAHMGLLTAFTFAFALITDFFLLPPLLMLIGKDKLG